MIIGDKLLKKMKGEAMTPCKECRYEEWYNGNRSNYEPCPKLIPFRMRVSNVEGEIHEYHILACELGEAKDKEPEEQPGKIIVEKISSLYDLTRRLTELEKLKPSIDDEVLSIKQDISEMEDDWQSYRSRIHNHLSEVERMAKKRHLITMEHKERLDKIEAKLEPTRPVDPEPAKIESDFGNKILVPDHILNKIIAEAHLDNDRTEMKRGIKHLLETFLNGGGKDTGDANGLS